MVIFIILNILIYANLHWVELIGMPFGLRAFSCKSNYWTNWDFNLLMAPDERSVDLFLWGSHVYIHPIATQIFALIYMEDSPQIGQQTNSAICMPKRSSQIYCYENSVFYVCVKKVVSASRQEESNWPGSQSICSLWSATHIDSLRVYSR